MQLPSAARPASSGRIEYRAVCGLSIARGVFGRTVGDIPLFAFHLSFPILFPSFFLAHVYIKCYRIAIISSVYQGIYRERERERDRSSE